MGGGFVVLLMLIGIYRCITTGTRGASSFARQRGGAGVQMYRHDIASASASASAAPTMHYGDRMSDQAELEIIKTL